ncbi:MAG: hypothetical protein V4628_13905 [Pseudomonadota bacterium]
MKWSIQVLHFLLASIVGMCASAQEGYPLDGTWRGEYGQPGAEGTLAVVVMEWDGSVINGRINPGRNTINFTSASLNPENWSVHFEATSPQGQPIVVDGVLENIGSYTRTITGTWKVGDVESPIVLTRE